MVETLGTMMTVGHYKKAGRLEWLRGVMGSTDGTHTVTPVGAQGSHMLTGLARADSLIEISADSAGIEPGDEVLVRRLRWFD